LKYGGIIDVVVIDIAVVGFIVDVVVDVIVGK